MAKQSFDPEMLTALTEKIDPLDDLTKSEWDNLRDWEGWSFAHSLSRKYSQSNSLK